MTLKENVPLAPFTTFGVGGEARFFVEARTEEDIEEAIAFARERSLPLFPLGRGSNVLVPDAGVAGVVLKMEMKDVRVEEENGDTLIVADAGALWDDVVDVAAERGAFGIENLAGIPGTVGGAAVQNIGAYGAELSSVFAYADVLESVTSVRKRIERGDAALGYRTSIFKKHPELIICRVALRLAKDTEPNLSYADVAHAVVESAPLTAPADIARAIRAIRAGKFPCERGEGTAGSFFKNPIVSREEASSLAERFAGLPTFPQEDGAVKIPLAWLLDHALALKGHAKGKVRLYEKQPLVVVAQRDATAADIDALARDVAARVREETGISIEREVETFGARA